MLNGSMVEKMTHVKVTGSNSSLIIKFLFIIKAISRHVECLDACISLYTLMAVGLQNLCLI